MKFEGKIVNFLQENQILHAIFQAGYYRGYCYPALLTQSNLFKEQEITEHSFLEEQIQLLPTFLFFQDQQHLTHSITLIFLISELIH